MSKAIDLSGQKFGALTVLRRDEDDHNKWICQCDCGNIKTSSRSNLKHKTTGLHCGCQDKRGPKVIDLVGKRFGKLLVLGRVSRSQTNGKIRWKCVCDCGKEKEIFGADLRHGSTKSCGCARYDHLQPYYNPTHGESRRGSHTPRYEMWGRARNRALKKNLPFSIKVEDVVVPEVCPLLGIPLKFYKGNGPSDNSPALDQIIPSAGYTPENSWVVSHRANTMKSNGSLEELKLIVRNLEKKINELNGNIVKN